MPKFTVALSALTVAQLKKLFKPLGYDVELRITKPRTPQVVTPGASR